MYIQQLLFPGNVRELENMLERALALCDGQTITIEDLSLDELPAALIERRTTVMESTEDTLWAASQPAIAPSAITPAMPPAAPAPVSLFSTGDMLPKDVSLSDYLEEIEKRTILQALEKTNNNKTAAAKLLGISFRTLRYRLSKLGLSKEQDIDDAEGDEE